jgi:serine phosphatase RsbU (regulator of sigma subunit)
MNTFLLLSTLNLTLGGLVFLLGVIILREDTRNRLNRVVAMLLFFGGLGSVLAALSFMAGRAATAPSAERDLLDQLAYLWEFYFPTLFLFASIFPAERTFVRRLQLPGPMGWSPGFGTLVYAPHVFHFALMLVLGFWRPELDLPQVGPLRYVPAVVDVFGVFGRLFLLVHRTLFSVVNLAFGVAAVLLLIDSYRQTRVPRIRSQLGVIGAGLTASLLCYVAATSIPELLNLTVPPAWRAGLTVAAITIGTGSIVWAIVAHRFLDARLLARRAILYALTSAALIGLYLLVLAPVNRFIRSIPGVDHRIFEPVLLVIALVLFQPALARLEEMLDQAMMRDPNDHRNVLRALGRELQTTIDLETLLSRTIRTVAESLLLRNAHVVAFAGRGALSYSGAGTVLDSEALHRLREALPAVPDTAASWRVADGVEGLSAEDQAWLARGLGLELLVPLRWRGEMLGAMLLGSKLTGTRYLAEDTQLLNTLAGQVSVSLQNALLLRERVAVARFEQELELARQIQRTSLLQEFPRHPRLDVHAVYIPSRQVGGDFYDVVPDGPGSWLVAIADVSGKGVPAALLSSMLQASLRTQAGSGASLESILQGINGVLYRSTALHQFATFFLARVEGDRLHMRFSNAGHNWPVVLRANGERMFLEKGGTLLGIIENLRFEEAEVQLEPGDLVVLYTDGVSEAADRDGTLFGEERLCEHLASLPRGLTAREVTDRTLTRLHEYLAEVEPQDDVTMLVLRVLEPVPAPTAGLAGPGGVPEPQPVG